eukprot:scaffold49035_cov38-Prasinocladus_malaysianus.AAC.2
MEWTTSTIRPDYDLADGKVKCKACTLGCPSVLYSNATVELILRSDFCTEILMFNACNGHR